VILYFNKAFTHQSKIIAVYYAQRNTSASTQIGTAASIPVTQYYFSMLYKVRTWIETQQGSATLEHAKNNRSRHWNMGQIQYAPDPVTPSIESCHRPLYLFRYLGYKYLPHRGSIQFQIYSFGHFTSLPNSHTNASYVLLLLTHLSLSLHFDDKNHRNHDYKRPLAIDIGCRP
jgi:hypothetical protein